MRNKSYILALVAAMCLWPAVGCMHTWRPMQPASLPADTQAVATRPAVTPADYLREWRWGRWVYQRREMIDGGYGEADRYVRQTRGRRLSEGTLVNRPLLPLKMYLQSPGAATQPGADDRPKAPLGKLSAAFFELGEPMDPIPPEAFEGTPVVSTTELRYFDRLGRLVATGALMRTAVLERYEDVTCPAGRYERCARLRVDLEVRFPLILTINWNSYVWLSPEVGEVRRVQQFSGWFLVFWFYSAHEFLLESWHRAGGKPPVQPPAYWSHGLVNLGRGVPKPCIDGLVVDVVTTQPVP